jgi:hypothetical protein
MLVCAGLIEGFISPSQLPREIKLAAATVFALAMTAYFVFAGHGHDDVDQAEAFGER